MRIRSTKPAFWRSKTIAELDWATRLVLKGIESYVDDNGVGKDDLALIAADVFPRDLSANPRDTLASLSEAIFALAEHGLIVRYEVDGEELLYVDRWNQQQRIDKPAKGRFRRPDGTLEYVEDVDRASYAVIREVVARPPETVALGIGEQGSRGVVKTPSASADAERVDAIANDFATWWAAYPRKKDKGHALKAYRTARKKVDGETLLTSMQQQARFLMTGGPDKCPYGATWLNGERWEDEPDEPIGAARLPKASELREPPSGLTDEEYDAWLRGA